MRAKLKKKLVKKKYVSKRKIKSKRKTNSRKEKAGKKSFGSNGILRGKLPSPHKYLLFGEKSKSEKKTNLEENTVSRNTKFYKKNTSLKKNTRL